MIRRAVGRVTMMIHGYLSPYYQYPGAPKQEHQVIESRPIFFEITQQTLNPKLKALNPKSPNTVGPKTPNP